ncbi:HAMP domain-containing sensor histidine kinase [uncultured Algimonas sp.]|uniref:sensor histidine kinase n=1 Tax=uncultured Algimonas sp. TaxID=1547920 RepID=UPI00262D0760|nr:HAMP domain-containing sensor histidine kinase [uncultured Algimonas sp.]
MPDGPNPSLVSRLVRAALLWTVPALLITLLLLTWFYRNTVYSSFDDPLESAVTALIASVEVSPDDGGLTLTRQPLDPRYQRALSGRYWLIGRVGSDGTVVPVIASRSLYGESVRLAADARAELAASSGEPVRVSAQGPNADEPLRVVAREVFLSGMPAPVAVLAAADRRPATRSIQRFAGAALLLMGLLTAGLLAAVYAQVRLGLRPLFELASRVAAVREGRVTSVGGRYPAEIAGVADELNSLIAHNRNVVERAQTHVGNLAHGLKTPIAVLRNEAGLEPTVAADVVRRQTEAMSAQVDHHLRRARAAARGQAIGLSCEVDDVIGALARTLPRIHRDKDFIIEVDGQAGLRFRGDKRDLEDMVGNLMDNAAKWTGSRIDVVRRGDGPDLCISIDDDGPGIPEEELETALKRGARLDEATPGSGLGLAIVSDLAEAYGGTLSLRRSMLGGLQAELHLPRALKDGR